MKIHLLIFSFCVLCLLGCKPKKHTIITKKSQVTAASKQSSAKPIVYKPEKTSKTTSKPTSKASKIVNYSKTFLGTRYKWGGTNKSGMDCSGLVHESFKTHGIYLPRISRDIAKKGQEIALKRASKGDLLFFKTGKTKRNSINHVGLIVSVNSSAISFIHATTSKGVIISSLNESYWKNAFVEVRRIL